MTSGWFKVRGALWVRRLKRLALYFAVGLAGFIVFMTFNEGAFARVYTFPLDVLIFIVPSGPPLWLFLTMLLNSFLVSVVIWGSALCLLGSALRRRYLLKTGGGLRGAPKRAGVSIASFVAAQLAVTSVQLGWFGLVWRFGYPSNDINLIAPNLTHLAVIAAVLFLMIAGLEWQLHCRAREARPSTTAGSPRWRSLGMGLAYAGVSAGLLFTASRVEPWYGEGVIGPYAEFKRAYNRLSQSAGPATPWTADSLIQLMSDYKVLPHPNASVELLDPENPVVKLSLWPWRDKPKWAIKLKHINKQQCERLAFEFEKEKRSTKLKSSRNTIEFIRPEKKWDLESDAGWFYALIVKDEEKPIDFDDKDPYRIVRCYKNNSMWLVI